jgi:DNA mismatch repair protein MutS2
LADFQELFDHNQKMIHLGEKLDSIGKDYLNHDNKKRMIGEFLKVVGIENSKRKKQSKKQQQKETQRREGLKAEAKKKIEPIREQKNKKKKQEKQEQKEAKQKQIVSFKENDRVRLEDSHSIGSIDRIEKKKAFVNYGIFTTEVALDRLELVQRAKK